MKKLPITERINILEDIFKITKPSKEEKALIAYKGKQKRILGAQALLIAEIIADVYNEGTVLDWNNTKQKKWFGWYDYSKKGSGFGVSACFTWDGSYSYVSSRLHFKEENLFWDAVKKFPKVYQRLMEKQ